MADRLLTEWAQLAQLGAWMAHEAGQHGLSQRYFINGLHAAHTAGDRTVGTYLLAFASKRRVIQGRLDDGVDLGRAARDAVELANAAYEVAKSTPPAVRALAVSTLATAQAAVGTRTASTPPLTRPAPCLTPQERWTLATTAFLEQYGGGADGTRHDPSVRANLADYICGRRTFRTPHVEVAFRAL